MPPNNKTITKDVLQIHCDEIIIKLERAIQAAVFAKHLKSASTSDIQKALEAVRDNKNDYFQAISVLYPNKDLPQVYANVYDSALSEPSTSSYCSAGTSEDRQAHSSQIYKINAGQIIRQLNDDFLSNQPRDCWVSYNKPYLNFIGEITTARIGALNYTMCWLDGLQDMLEEKTIYLDIINDGLVYKVIDPNGYMKTGKISLNEILNVSLQGKFYNPEDDVIYAEIEVNSHKIWLKNLVPFSIITEDDASLNTQEQCTAIIDRLVDAVYWELYRKYLPATTDAFEQEKAQADACNRYQFYIDTVKKLYGSDAISKTFERVYQEAIKHANVNIDNKLLRHSIRIGCILSQLNQDFVLNNQENSQWFVYNKPYLDFLGNTVKDPIGKGIYQTISLNKHTDSLTYCVRNPNGDIQNGNLSLDNLLTLVKFEHRERLSNDIYVKISEVSESSSTYCYSFIISILAHPIFQVVALALLTIGVALAFSTSAIGVGVGLAVVGSGIVIAGFFAPKKMPKKEMSPDFFTKQNPCITS